MKPEKFLHELKAHDTEQFKIVSILRTLILKASKDVHEEIKYGGLYYSLDKPFAGLFVYKNHVTLGFTNGASLSDPEKILVGTGKQRRHIQVASTQQIHPASIRKLITQAVRKQ